jgi:hypothetical protein
MFFAVLQNSYFGSEVKNTASLASTSPIRLYDMALRHEGKFNFCPYLRHTGNKSEGGHISISVSTRRKFSLLKLQVHCLCSFRSCIFRWAQVTQIMRSPCHCEAGFLSHSEVCGSSITYSNINTDFKQLEYFSKHIKRLLKPTAFLCALRCTAGTPAAKPNKSSSTRHVL